ncbi:hypothetical protein FQR65_LT11806 [Abscondita terminalis]|nr:hypothetical protein FQR65_LT11806 [Abscondita terminalis]
MSALQEQNRGENFFRYEKFGLKCVGVWRTKDDSTGYKIYSSVVIAMFTCAYYIILAFDVLTQNFYDVIDSWVVFIGFSIVVVVNLNWWLNINNIENLLQKIGKKNFVRNFYQNDSFEHSAISKWYRYKNIYSATYLITFFISIVLQFIYTLTLRYTKTDPNEWKLGYGSISVLNIKYSPVFEIFCIYQNLTIIYVGVSIAIIFSIIVGTLNFIATQLRILQNDINVVVLDDDTHLIDKEKLKSFIHNHVRLLKLTDEVSTIYSKTILATFLGVMISNCLDIYLMSVLPVRDLTSVALFLEVVSALFAIFLICAASDNIDNESIRLAKAVYEVNFVGTSLSFQKSLIIILRQAQKPIEIKSAGIMNVSFITFTAMLRIIYSAHTMLKTVRTNNL